MHNRLSLHVIMMIVLVILSLACNASTTNTKLDVLTIGDNVLPIGFPLNHLWVNNCKKGKALLLNDEGPFINPSWTCWFTCKDNPSDIYYTIKEQALNAGLKELISWPPNSSEAKMKSDGFNACIHAQGLYGNEDGWQFDAGYWDLTKADKDKLKKANVSIAGDLKVWGLAITTPDKSGLKVN